MAYKSKYILISLGQLIGALLLLSQNNKTVAQELFPVQQAGKWGYQNTQGNLVITPQYTFAKRFKDQYAIVANQKVGRHPPKVDQCHHIERARLTSLDGAYA